MTHTAEMSHIERARQRLRDRAQARFEQFEEMRCQAVSDVRAIADMIAGKYEPVCIYQWGSVLRPGDFRDYSDIDIAVEGITDAQTFFRLLADAQALTHFSLDIVQMEKILPEYAEDIRHHGRVVYERA